MSSARAILVAVTLLGLAGGPAQAASVTSDGEGLVNVTAAPGETNDVQVTLAATGDRIVVSDSGAPVTTGPGCTAVDARSAECATGPNRPIALLKLGDGDDKAVVNAPVWGDASGDDGDDQLTACSADGGPGNDMLTGCNGFGPNVGHELDGGPGDDMLSGGDGDDGMDGGPGRDMLRGGPGNDSLRSGLDYYEVVGEYYDGGEGRDTLAYGGGQTSTVDLAAGTARRDDGDVSSVIGIEDLTTGAGDNVLLGDDGDNTLDAGQGADVVDGRGGADTIVDRAGADTMRGGPGDDHIITADLYRDSIDCGDGADRLASDRLDGPVSGCEGNQTVTYDVIAPRLHVQRGQVLIAPRCSVETHGAGLVTEGLGTCALRLTLRVRFHGRDLLVGHTACVSEVHCDYHVPLTRRARTLLRGRSLPGTVELTPDIGLGGIPTREHVTVVRGR